jgi:hypothetical protein
VPVYTDRSKYRANQGDLFESVALECPWPEVGMATVMLISQDCDCDKYLEPKTPLTEAEEGMWRVTIACVHPLDQLTGGRMAAARDERMPRYLPLPDEGGRGDLVVDLWTVQPIRFADLLERARIASLSDEWRQRLWWKIVRLRLGEKYRQILETGLTDAA